LCSTSPQNKGRRSAICYSKAMRKLFRRKKSLLSNQKGIGGRGEDAAVAYLQNQKYKIITLNWFNPGGKRLGEIDIVAREGAEIVFVEVKTRSVAVGVGVVPEEQITRAKVQKLDRVAQKYIAQHGLWNVSWRIDAISVVYAQGDDRDPEIKHLKSIFY